MQRLVTREMVVSILTIRDMHIAYTCSKRLRILGIASTAKTMTMVGPNGVSTGILLSIRTKNTGSP